MSKLLMRKETRYGPEDYLTPTAIDQLQREGKLGELEELGFDTESLVAMDPMELLILLEEHLYG